MAKSSGEAPSAQVIRTEVAGIAPPRGSVTRPETLACAGPEVKGSSVVAQAEATIDPEASAKAEQKTPALRMLPSLMLRIAT